MKFEGSLFPEPVLSRLPTRRLPVFERLGALAVEGMGQPPPSLQPMLSDDKQLSLNNCHIRKALPISCLV